MKAERLFRVLGLVDEDLIEEAASPAVCQRKFPLWKTLAAACLGVICLLSFSFLLGRMGGSKTGATAPGEASSNGDGGSGIATDNEPLSVDGTTFMSYAGPVFPLTLAEENGGLTAERTTTWDFTPGTYHDGTPRQWGAGVTDSYTIVNITDSEQNMTALYPFTGSFTELASQQPTVTVDGEEVERTLYAGAYVGGFRDAGVDDGSTWNLEYPDSWTDYKDLLEDGRYLDAALGDGPVLDIPVTVYEFTDFEAPHKEYDAATQSIEFTIDQGKTTVLAYGFNGASWDEDTGWRQYSYFVPNGVRRDKDPKLLVVLGEDITDYALGGYENGGCEKEIDGVSCTVTRREATLDEVLDVLCRDYLETYADWQYGMTEDETAAVPYALFRRAVGELMVQYGPMAGGNTVDRYADGRLDDIISEAMSMDRVLYLAVPVTVPAGGKVNITFALWKEPSFDFGCSGSENMGLQGYDFVTRLGSTLAFTGQQAALVNTDGIQIERQNFGFDLEQGVTEVTLAPETDHYYLEIRPKE